MITVGEIMIPKKKVNSILEISPLNNLMKFRF